MEGKSLIIHVYIGIRGINGPIEGGIVCFYIDGTCACIYIYDRTAVSRHVIALQSQFVRSVASFAVIPRIFWRINYDEKRSILVSSISRNIVVYFKFCIAARSILRCIGGWIF